MYTATIIDLIHKLEKVIATNGSGVETVLYQNPSNLLWNLIAQTTGDYDPICNLYTNIAQEDMIFFHHVSSILNMIIMDITETEREATDALLEKQKRENNYASQQPYSSAKVPICLALVEQLSYEGYILKLYRDTSMSNWYAIHIIDNAYKWVQVTSAGTPTLAYRYAYEWINDQKDKWPF